MGMTTSQAEKDVIATALLERYGQTFCAELGIDISANTPPELFRLLCASILFSARIRASTAVSAAKALFAQGWTSAESLARTTWEERVRVLNRSGYARYDESTSRMLGDTVELLLETYGGDLRRLRAEANFQPAEERHLLKQFKGLGDVGVNIFFREVQVAWDELYPFADAKAIMAARRLGLGADAEELARLVDREDFARLVAALVRVALAKAFDEFDSGDGRCPTG